MCTFTLDSTHFILNKCPIYTHDGASVKFRTNSQETDYSVGFHFRGFIVGPVISFSVLSSFSCSNWQLLSLLSRSFNYYCIFTVADAMHRKLTLGCEFLSSASQITPLSNVDGRRGVACTKKRDLRTSIHRHRSLSFVGDLSSFRLLSLINAVSSSPLYPNVTLKLSCLFIEPSVFLLRHGRFFFLFRNNLVLIRMLTSQPHGKYSTGKVFSRCRVTKI